jgi:cobalt-precorrin 5A hydrolase/precorrin-3B C17-methyltransferase
LRKHNLAPQSIHQYGSIDLKEDEPAINQFENVYFFTAEQLKAEAPRLVTPSAVVEQEVGVPGVAEAAALALAGPKGKLIVSKVKSKRATIAIAQAASYEDLNDTAGAATRFTWLVVGIGPGDSALMTPQVDLANSGRQEWVGYSLYLDLIEHLRNGQTRHDFPARRRREALPPCHRPWPGRASASHWCARAIRPSSPWRHSSMS